jgi:hypothetical protein
MAKFSPKINQRIKNHFLNWNLWFSTSRAVDRGFEPWSNQAKHYEIGICGFYAKHIALGVWEKIGWLGIRIMCPNGVTCLHHGLLFLVS